VTFMWKWGSEGKENGQFSRPWGIGGAHDRVYVSDSFNSRVQAFDPRGKFITELPNYSGNRLEVDSDGRLYLLHSTGRGDRIDIFIGWDELELIKTITLENTASRGIATDIYGNEIFVTDITEHKVFKYDSEGNLLMKWDLQGIAFRNPWGIAVDRYHKHWVYVTDSSDQVMAFSNDGEFIKKWGTHGTGEGEFDSPIDIAVDTAGYIYVLDSGNARVQVFNSKGECLGQWGSVGTDDGEFLDPYGIAIDLNDNIYVLDSGNFRVQVFRVSMVP